jgi:hypothetical protein
MPPTPQNDRFTTSECTGMREGIGDEVPGTTVLYAGKHGYSEGGGMGGGPGS